MQNTSTSQERVIHVERCPGDKVITTIAILFCTLVWTGVIISIIGIPFIIFIIVPVLMGHIIYIAYIRGNAIRISPDQFSDLYEDVKGLSKKIGLRSVPETYLLRGDTLNALSTRFFMTNIMILYSELLDACGDNKAARDMIIAHELGHLHQGHIQWFWFFLPVWVIPFFGPALSRAREYTCDRYGFAMAGDKEGALRGLVILSVGSKRAFQVNMEAFVQQKEDINTGLMTIGRWFNTHPPLTLRILALDETLNKKFPLSRKGVVRALVIFVSIFIIPILAAIAIPQFAKMQKMAKEKISKETPFQEEPIGNVEDEL